MHKTIRDRWYTLSFETRAVLCGAAWYATGVAIAAVLIFVFNL